MKSGIKAILLIIYVRTNGTLNCNNYNVRLIFWLQKEIQKRKEVRFTTKQVNFTEIKRIRTFNYFDWQSLEGVYCKARLLSCTSTNFIIMTTDTFVLDPLRLPEEWDKGGENSTRGIDWEVRFQKKNDFWWE